MTEIRAEEEGFLVESDTRPIIENENTTSTNKEQNVVWSKRWPIFGGILALGSSLMYTFYGILIKKFNLDFVDNMFVRSMIQIPLLMVFVILRRKSLFLEFSEEATRREKVMKYLVLMGSGFLTGFNEHISYLGVLYVPIGDAMTIIFTAPIFTMIFSFIFLRLRQGIWKIIFAFILIVGVILVVRPPFIFPQTIYNLETQYVNETYLNDDSVSKNGSMYWIGVGICVLAAACTGLINVVLNHLKDIDSGVMMFWNGFMSIFCSFAFLSIDHDSQIFFKHDLNWNEMGELIALGAMGISAVWMVTGACKLLDPTICSVLRAQQLIFAYVAQTIVSQVIPYYLTFIGAGFVVLSAVCMSLEKYVVPKFPERLRKYF